MAQSPVYRGSAPACNPVQPLDLVSHVKCFTLHCSQLASWGLAFPSWTRRESSFHLHCHLSLLWVPALLFSRHYQQSLGCTLSLALADPAWISPDTAGARGTCGCLEKKPLSVRNVGWERGETILCFPRLYFGIKSSSFH